MPTNDRGDLGHTKLCKVCRMRCTKDRDFYDPSRQASGPAEHLAKTTCTFCISHMVDEGHVAVLGGILTVHKVHCRTCKEMTDRDKMVNLHRCKACHSIAQQKHIAKKRLKTKKKGK